MNVYDFDNTIYDGESVVDFYLFALKRHPRIITVLPKILHMLIKYKTCKMTEEELLRVAEKYAARLSASIDFEGMVSDFWDKNQCKIKEFYLKQHQDDDVIISAGWSFLLEEIGERLGINNIIASQINIDDGNITQLCFKGNKPKLFKESFPDESIDAFYTDSMNDAPMFSLAKRIFLVKGNKVREMIE